MIREDSDEITTKTFVLSFRKAWILGIIFVLFYIGLWIAFGFNRNLQAVVSFIMVTISYLAVTIILYITSRYVDSSEKRMKSAWTFLMLAVLISLFGNLFWVLSIFSHQNPTTSMAEFFYILFYPLFLIGILLFPSSKKTQIQRFKHYFDLVIIMFSFLLIFWIFLLAPGFKNFSGNLNYLTIMLSYVIGGLVLVLAISDLLLNRLKEDMHTPVLLLLTSTLVILITNSIYIYQFIHNSYFSGDPSDIGWIIGYLLIGLAGVSQFNNQKVKLDFLIDISSNIYRNYSFTSYLAFAGVSVGYLSLIWAYNTRSSDLTFLEFGVGVLIVLVVFRQFVSINENKNLYKKAQNEIALRKEISQNLKDSELAYRTIFENTGTATVIIDEYDVVSLSNTEFEKLSGYKKEDIENKKSWIDFVYKEDLKLMLDENQLRIVENRSEPRGYEFRLVNKNGEIRNVYALAVLIPNSKGSLISLLDVTNQKNAENEIKRSLKEKETLLKEIHHRVKNNLTVISSLLNLQSRYIKDKDDLKMFMESQSRAKSMAIIHQKLYSSSDLKHIDFEDYIKTLATDIFDVYVQDPSEVKMFFDVDDIKLDINTSIPLGLILNELLTNTLKYAFPQDEEGVSKISNGTVTVKLHKNEGGYKLTVEDNGVGLPADFDINNTSSLGLQLINTLTQQIDGHVSYSSKSNGGTSFIVDFKDKLY
jgi:two-component system, sensor histidine kinase PdtaS